MTDTSKVLWKARKRNCFGLPWTFTTYELREDKLCINAGFLTRTFDEIKLYRIRDFTVRKSLIQRIFGLGTIHICSADSTSPEFDIINIRDAIKVKDLISDQVEIARKAADISSKEIMGNNISHEYEENSY